MKNSVLFRALKKKRKCVTTIIKIILNETQIVKLLNSVQVVLNV